MTVRKQLALLMAILFLLPGYVQAQQSLLPITPGAWVQDREQCAAASTAWVYDGTRVGHVFYYVNPRMGHEPQGELSEISLIRKVPGGYTEYKPEGFGELGRMLVKPINSDRISLVLRAPTNRQGMQESEEKLKRCDVNQLAPRMQTALQRFAPTLVASAHGPVATPVSQEKAVRWQVATPANGAPAMAYVEGPPAMNAIGLQCQSDGSFMMSVAAQGQRMDRQLVTTFSSPLDGSNIDATLMFDPRSKLFRGKVSSALVGLFGGNDTVIDIRISRQPAGQVSNLGSTAAIRNALAPCLGMESHRTSGGTTPVPPLGIAAGYYVNEGTSCTDPIDAFYYDGKKAGVIFAEDGMAPEPIGKVTKEGGEYFLPNAAILVKVLGTSRVQLTIQDTGGPMRLCATEQVPQSIRRLVR